MTEMPLRALFWIYFLALGLLACGTEETKKPGLTPGNTVHAEAEDVVFRSSSAITCPQSSLQIHCDMSHIIFDDIQHLRKSENVDYLVWDHGLADQAHIRACELGELGILTHDGWQDRIRAAGLSPGGENIVMVNRPELESTAERMFTVWEQSPPHRNNMVAPLFNRVGVGVCRGSKGLFGVQLFSPDL